MHVKRDDIVKILAGKDRGKEGKIIRVYLNKGRVLVEGVNRVKRHVKPNKKNQKGGIVEKEMPVDASNVKRVTAAA